MSDHSHQRNPSDATSRLLAAARQAPARHFSLTCADCSSMGWDMAHGHPPFPKEATCSHCGGKWPKHPWKGDPEYFKQAAHDWTAK